MCAYTYSLCTLCTEFICFQVSRPADVTFGPWKTKFVVCDQMGNIFIHLSERQRQQEQQQQQLRKQQQESLTIFEWLFKRFGASSPRNERFKWFWANWLKLVRSWAWQGIYLFFIWVCVFLIKCSAKWSTKHVRHIISLWLRDVHLFAVSARDDPRAVNEFSFSHYYYQLAHIHARTRI